MNISHKHRLIWWAPERTGTKITRQIFKDFDFMVFDPKIGDEKPLSERYTSHLNQIPEKYSDYKIICNVRNPYDRIFSIFLMTMYENILIDKNSRSEVKEKFNEWVLQVFEPQKLEVSINSDHAVDDINYDFFSKWVFDGKIPDFFIRMEFLVEDLSNLELIRENSEWTEEKIQNLLESNPYKTKKNVFFNQMYNFDAAKRIYFFYKRVFNLISYNPFSFTIETLSDSEKKSFLHDIL